MPNAKKNYLYVMYKYATVNGLFFCFLGVSDSRTNPPTSLAWTPQRYLFFIFYFYGFTNLEN